MRGHVERKGRRWYVVVDLGRDPESGKRRREWHSGFRTRDDAKDALTDLLYGGKRGTYVAPDKVTVGGFLRDVWLPAIRGSIDSNTHGLHSTNVRAYIAPHIAAIRLQDLRLHHVNTMYAELSETGGRRRTGLSPASVRNVHRTLYRALKDAVKWEKINRNVAEGATLPKPRERDMQTWTAAQLHAFLDHVADDDLFAAWLLAARTGVRRAELLGLHWRDVDLDAGTIRIVWTLTVVAGKPMLRASTKTRTGRRQIPLEPETVAALRAHRKTQTERRLALGSVYVDNDLVFDRGDGEPLNPNTFADRFERLSAATGVPRIRFQDVRHAFATLALEAGIAAKVVSEILGHAHVSITLDTYSHVHPMMQRDAVGRVAALVRGASARAEDGQKSAVAGGVRPGAGETRKPR